MQVNACQVLLTLQISHTVTLTLSYQVAGLRTVRMTYSSKSSSNSSSSSGGLLGCAHTPTVYPTLASEWFVPVFCVGPVCRAGAGTPQSTGCRPLTV
jgi:hypothetical protein